VEAIARAYVDLVLQIGLHDEHYVDAYYGPKEWREQAEQHKPSLTEIASRATLFQAEAKSLVSEMEDELHRMRAEFLVKQLGAVAARAEMLSGKTFSFDEESLALYDVVSPEHADDHYDSVLRQVETILPGSGPLHERFNQFREKYYVPTENLSKVFSAAIDEARTRTKRYIDLAPHENFRIEYVKDQVWGAYNWYKGNSESLIEVNTDFPIAIDRVIDLCCHEGYPGHHVYNALLEQHLAKKLGWMEFTVYPLFSPQSLIAEGTAEYGIELTFSHQDRQKFEREVLYPMAGLSPDLIRHGNALKSAMAGLTFISNDAAKRYLDGKVSREATINWLAKYSLIDHKRAEQRVRFIEANRSYVITYNVGKYLIAKYIEAQAPTLEGRWQAFEQILKTPQTPSGLVAQP